MGGGRGGGGGGWFKAKGSQVPHIPPLPQPPLQRVPKFLICSPKEFSIAPLFYPICFGKCCHGEDLYTSKWNLLLQGASIVSIFLSDGPINQVNIITLVF